MAVGLASDWYVNVARSDMQFWKAWAVWTALLRGVSTFAADSGYVEIADCCDFHIRMLALLVTFSISGTDMILLG